MSSKPLDIIIVGGGAAGFFAAITCATNNPRNRVTILEQQKHPLAKVKISGGGRCNVTHHCFEPKELVQAYPRGGKALRGAFSRFQPRDTVAWFADKGVKLKTEADGRMFPITDNSATIIQCLTTTAKARGVNLRCNTGVKTISQEVETKKFILTLKQGEKLTADRLLIATGSSRLGHVWAKKLGHKIITPVPSLFTFNIPDPRLKGLAGISVENAKIRLLNPGKNKLEETGSILITHWGLSGPGVLKLSAKGARILAENSYKITSQINWLPEYNSETLREYLLTIKQQNPRKLIANYAPANLPKRLWQKLVNYVGINNQKPWSQLDNKSLNKIVIELLQGKYQITGKGIFKEEFVTCGGVELKEINFQTMASKICENLYFAGEILDIDGITGGFNFQSAWTTGWLAGKAMAAN